MIISMTAKKSFDRIWQDSGRQYLESHLKGKSATQDRRKKTPAKFGETVICNSHPYMQGIVNKFAVSPLMQELIVYAGHLECYAKSEEIIEKYTRVKVSPPQAYRVTDYAGESPEKKKSRQNVSFSPLSKEDTRMQEWTVRCCAREIKNPGKKSGRADCSKGVTV